MEQINSLTWTWGRLAPYFDCNCDKHLDDRTARWLCPVHGSRKPNYDAMDKIIIMDARDRIIMAAEARAEGDR